MSTAIPRCFRAVLAALPVPIAGPAAVLLAALIALPLAGCETSPHAGGYSFGSTFDENIQTVAVPIFENVTFTTGLEATLTDALVKRIQSQTPWRVTSQARADTTITGTITDVRTRTLSSAAGTGLVEEQPLTLTVSFTWRDNRTGDTLIARQSFAATATFVPARGIDGQPGERIEVGQRAAIDELAEAIVHELRENW